MMSDAPSSQQVTVTDPQPAAVKAPTISYRGFFSDLERTASEWIKEPVTKDSWKPNGKKFGGESQTLGVTNGTRNDVAKPGKKLDGGNTGICYAAHEKIASDLAYHLGLPVPPVVLWERTDASDAEHRWCSVSAWVFPGARKFGEVGTVPAENQGRAGAALSAMTAFDAWIGVEDRNNDNLVIDGDYKSSQPIACLDYSWSLSKTWTKGNYPRSPISNYVQHFGGLSVRDQKLMADRICDMEKTTISAIVNGIPETFLPLDRAGTIIEGLLNGQGTLHRLLGLSA
jgi:hypothetical protein